MGSETLGAFNQVILVLGICPWAEAPNYRQCHLNTSKSSPAPQCVLVPYTLPWPDIPKWLIAYASYIMSARQQAADNGATAVIQHGIAVFVRFNDETSTSMHARSSELHADMNMHARHQPAHACINVLLLKFQVLALFVHLGLLYGLIFLLRNRA